MSDLLRVPTVVAPPHVCDFDHRWDAERKVWLCMPNPPWFGRSYTSGGSHE